MRKQSLCFALLAALFVAGCGARSYYGKMDQGSDPQQLAALVSGATTRSSSIQHGTQVEYLSPDGRAYLWYPGNPRILPGRWRVEKRGLGAQICFTYMPQPVSGWSCQGGGNYLVNQAEIVDGDPLDLEGGKLPFVMSRTSYRLSDLIARTGNPSAPLRSRLETPILSSSERVSPALKGS